MTIYREICEKKLSLNETKIILTLPIVLSKSNLKPSAFWLIYKIYI